MTTDYIIQLSPTTVIFPSNHSYPSQPASPDIKTVASLEHPFLAERPIIGSRYQTHLSVTLDSSSIFQLQAQVAHARPSVQPFQASSASSTSSSTQSLICSAPPKAAPMDISRCSKCQRSLSSGASSNATNGVQLGDKCLCNYCAAMAMMS